MLARLPTALLSVNVVVSQEMKLCLWIILLFLSISWSISKEISILWCSNSHSFNNSQLWRIEATMGDTLKFLCPTSADERSVIYRVDKNAAENCLVLNTSESIVGTCLAPYDSVMECLRSSKILPNKHVYEAGKTYYFITTSTGERNGTYNTAGGLCRKRGMKLEVYVKAKHSFGQFKKHDSIVNKGKQGSAYFEGAPYSAIMPKSNNMTKVVIWRHANLTGVDYEIEYDDVREGRDAALKNDVDIESIIFWLFFSVLHRYFTST